MKGCRPISPREFSLLTDWIRESLSLHRARRKAAVVTLMYGAGLRVSEAAQVRVADLAAGSVVQWEVRLEKHTTKGKHAGRTVPLHPFIRVEMQQWLDFMLSEGGTAGPWLFPAIHTKRPIHYEQCGHLNATQVRNTIYRARESLGLGPRVATHSMRKSCAKLLWEASGHNILVVKEALGHASIEDTQKYLNVSADALRSAVAGMFGAGGLRQSGD
jgi:integrase/recombinase XerC